MKSSIKNLMKIIADENIPYVEKVFPPLGQVSCVSGREITPAMLAEADALLVRSITQVGQELLENSPVRFVGTATIGTNHIDLDYLKNRDITFTSAAGSNANSVVEYVLTALGFLAQKHQWNLNGKTLGIIGAGNIGSLLEQKAQALGLKVFLNDPPLQKQQTGDDRFVSLDEALVCDIITCHVPLTQTGDDATYHLLDKKRLSLLNVNQILINSSRGPVVDNQALKQCLIEKTIGPVVLDVWENEPDINLELLRRVSLATPHIAGYSLDGKVNGTVMLFHALGKFLGQSSPLQADDLLKAPQDSLIELDHSHATEQSLFHQIATRIYPINRDDDALRQLEKQPREKCGIYFDQLRKNYPVRREAHNYTLSLNNPGSGFVEKLRLFGFETKSSLVS